MLTRVRAYIAASRRSDRSLEARVESARRASEIHKRRTGRSLRVTEQDVINEEMYEEEDDDLPLHYRRLTAHLQTGSVDFNRRLAAYLTNQVAMRSAMDQMINNSYAQQYPNAPQFAHNSSNTNNSFPSPMTNNPSLMQSPSSTYRAAPYPSPHHPNFRQMHMRANSIASPNEFTNGRHGQSSPVPQGSSTDGRRMSMPTTSHPAIKSPLGTSDIKPDPDHQQQTQSASTVQTVGAGFPPLWQDHSMFTTTLPPESQQLLAPALDPNDPFTASLMAGSEHFMSNPQYPWSTLESSKSNSTSSPLPTFNGMSSTLAPSALEMNTSSYTITSGSSFDATAAPSNGLDFTLSQDSSQLKGVSSLGGHYMARDGSTLGSGQVTPAEGFWESFVNDSGWGEETVTAAQ